jgi:hypothetical protein
MGEEAKPEPMLPASGQRDVKSQCMASLGEERADDRYAVASRSPPYQSAGCAAGADPPLAPIEHGRFVAIPSSHLGGAGLDLMAAILAPNDQPDAGSGSVTERHRRILWVVS